MSDPVEIAQSRFQKLADAGIVKQDLLSMLNELVGELQSLDLDDDGLEQKDHLVTNITDLMRLITNNEIKEKTKKLEEATWRVVEASAQLEADKEDISRTARNIRRITQVLGAVAGIIQFV